MPYKFQYTKVHLPKNKDRRRKLTDKQKKEIKELYGTISQRKLAKMFGVSRRLITFIGDPEKHKANLKARKERGGWKQYYDKNKHKKYMKNYRRYKQKILTKKS
ncbi:hypothetical protein K9M42_02815 [Patescibacteria group bacterium]|nr:hypothetical protein [Patescibacteria group bacterium]